ncbi:hypothetical protein [Actinacidiphila paucisporea]|uniref:Uncharacterized protein n=1 Tax=Actinacidiphila paucisporea TaxID=310782 RepID=A0A1M6XSP1_9ACTN|nr:hypothetical protein [Actinacidiphila paucisporea]SHL08869.1 hypothetical protein SAMN05216499_102512 [Actinacidiphila paucisporea]
MIGTKRLTTLAALTALALADVTACATEAGVPSLDYATVLTILPL